MPNGWRLRLRPLGVTAGRQADAVQVRAVSRDLELVRQWSGGSPAFERYLKSEGRLGGSPMPRRTNPRDLGHG
jgi:hypothetical protein